MGSVYRESYTKPVPPGAEFFTRKGRRFARWQDSRSRTHTAPTTTTDNGDVRIVRESPSS